MKELQKEDETVLFEVNSNVGGKMEVELTTDKLPDLRQKP